MTYISPRPPRVKQREASDAMRGHEVFALLMEMRTGKSKPIIDEFGASVLDETFTDLLVIAPAGAYRTWAREIPKDLPQEVLQRTLMHVWDGSKAKSKAAGRALIHFLGYTGPRILLMNVEALSQVLAARNLCLEYGSQRPGRNVAVVDESVTIKNPEAECSLFIVKKLSPLFARRRILTGLITPRSPLDVYSQFKFLDTNILGFDKFSLFSARYARTKQVCMLPQEVVQRKFRDAVGMSAGLSDDAIRRRIVAIMPDLNLDGMGRRDLVQTLSMSADCAKRDSMIDAILRMGQYIQTVPVVEGYENVDEIHQKIAPHSFRVRLSDCYDMPKSDYSFRDVEMSDEQRRIYREIREFATAKLSGEAHVTSTHVITQILRLHQVLCGFTRDDDGAIHEIPERRTAALLDLLNDYGGKAIVWCSYDLNVRKVSKALEREFGEGSVARFWGGNIKTREEEELLFKERDEVRWMVATPDAGRYSRTWDMADLTVFYSSKNNLDHRDQAESRVKNEGKMRMNSYVDLRVPDTVEGKFISALREKINMATAINGDNWREWLI